MKPPRHFFSQERDVTWVAHLHAFVQTRLQLAVNRVLVEDDLCAAVESGDVADTEEGIAEFSADYFDDSASIYPAALDDQCHGQRTGE